MLRCLYFLVEFADEHIDSVSELEKTSVAHQIIISVPIATGGAIASRTYTPDYGLLTLQNLTNRCLLR